MEKLTIIGRSDMLKALREMPDEGFAWFAMWAAGEPAPVYPEGLGGFQPEARKAIELLRKRARTWLEKQRG